MSSTIGAGAATTARACAMHFTTGVSSVVTAGVGAMYSTTGADAANTAGAVTTNSATGEGAAITTGVGAMYSTTSTGPANTAGAGAMYSTTGAGAYCRSWCDVPRERLLDPGGRCPPSCSFPALCARWRDVHSWSWCHVRHDRRRFDCTRLLALARPTRQAPARCTRPRALATPTRQALARCTRPRALERPSN